jgi:tetratricopeptide (TPR) repeat protein
MAPDINDINMIEAFIYVYSGRYADARLVLDYLESARPNDYHLHRAEIAFWQVQGMLEESVAWYERAGNAAETVPQKLRLRSGLGDCYLAMEQYEKAVGIYQEAVHFSKENPWLWHYLSLAHWNLEEDEEAARCNKHALNLDPDFAEAKKLEAMLKERMEVGGLKNRLFGR